MIETHAEQAKSDARMDMSMTVNGSVRTLRIEPRTTLLDALRDDLRLTALPFGTTSATTPHSYAVRAGSGCGLSRNASARPGPAR